MGQIFTGNLGRIPGSPSGVPESLPALRGRNPEFRKACQNFEEEIRSSGKPATISGKASGTPESPLRFRGTFPHHTEGLPEMERTHPHGKSFIFMVGQF
jgi:hypothetical protein